MILQDVLSQELIKVDMEAEDRDKAFEELIDFYCKIDKSNAKAEILKAITERETKMSTGIHKGIAVPHGKTEAVNAMRCILGISKKGIQYDSLDGEPVYILFMIISPMHDSQDHLRLLKHFSLLIENPQFQIELQLQKDPIAALKTIKKYEAALSVINTGN